MATVGSQEAWWTLATSIQLIRSEIAWTLPSIREYYLRSRVRSSPGYKRRSIPWRTCSSGLTRLTNPKERTPRSEEHVARSRTPGTKSTSRGSQKRDKVNRHHSMPQHPNLLPWKARRVRSQQTYPGSPKWTITRFHSSSTRRSCSCWIWNLNKYHLLKRQGSQSRSSSWTYRCISFPLRNSLANSIRVLIRREARPATTENLQSRQQTGASIRTTKHRATTSISCWDLSKSQIPHSKID